MVKIAAYRQKHKTTAEVLQDIFEMSDDDFDDSDSSGRDSDYRPCTSEADEEEKDRSAVVNQSVQIDIDSDHEYESNNLKTDAWITVGDRYILPTDILINGVPGINANAGLSRLIRFLKTFSRLF